MYKLLLEILIEHILQLEELPRKHTKIEHLFYNKFMIGEVIC